MKLYKLHQNINTGYDTFDSAVVVANSAEEAQNVVGEPDDDIYPGAIICASFNAG